MDIGRADGCLMTSKPEDMFNVIHVQLEVAQAQMPLEYMHLFVEEVIEVRYFFARGMYGAWAGAFIDPLLDCCDCY